MVQRYNTICFAEWDVDESGLGLRRLQRRLATDWLGAHVTLKIKDNPKRLGVKARERGLKKRGRETERLRLFFYFMFLLLCNLRVRSNLYRRWY